MSHTNCIDVLDTDLDTLLAEPLSTMGALALAERACELERITARVDAARTSTLAAAKAAPEAPAVMMELGYRNADQFVADRSHAEAKSVRASALLGDWLGGFAELQDAFAAGSLTRRHVEEIRKLDNDRTRHLLVADQQRFIDAAVELDFEDFKKVLAYWASAADPDGEEPRDQTARTGRRYRRRGDGSVDGRFTLDPLSAEVFLNALQKESQYLFRSDAASDGPMPRASQRDAQALLNLMIRGSGGDIDPAVTPLVNIVMSQTGAENLLARLDDPTIEPIPVDYQDPDRRCEFLDGTPLHPALAMVALAVARFRRIVLDANNKPIEASVVFRGFPPWMKQLLLVHGRGRCRSPGCDAPFPWLQADRINPASKGGPTKLSNGQMPAMFAEGKLELSCAAAQTVTRTTNGKATGHEPRSLRETLGR